MYFLCVFVAQIEELRLLLQLADGPEEQMDVTKQLKALLKSPAPEAPSIPVQAPVVLPSDASPATPLPHSPATHLPSDPTTTESGGQQPSLEESLTVAEGESEPDLLGNGGYEE